MLRGRGAKLRATQPQGGGRKAPLPWAKICGPYRANKPTPAPLKMGRNWELGRERTLFRSLLSDETNRIRYSLALGNAAASVPYSRFCLSLPSHQ